MNPFDPKPQLSEPSLTITSYHTHQPLGVLGFWGVRQVRSPYGPVDPSLRPQSPHRRSPTFLTCQKPWIRPHGATYGDHFVRCCPHPLILLAWLELNADCCSSRYLVANDACERATDALADDASMHLKPGCLHLTRSMRHLLSLHFSTPRPG